MVYIISTVFFRGTNAPEVARAGFQAQKKYPEDESIGKYIIYGAVNTTEEGGIAISVFEPKEGKEKEAIMWVSKRLYMYSSIEGVSYTSEVFSTYDEALEIAGIKRP
ncbi:MAG: hypothetical protein ACTSP6_07690 [Promethearchaeota archaeon]